MKFSYSFDRNAYVITSRGVVVDSDPDPAALRVRHQFCEVEDELQTLYDFGALPDPFEELDVPKPGNDDEDDLAVINDFLLFNDDHDTPTNYQSTGIGA